MRQHNEDPSVAKEKGLRERVETILFWIGPVMAGFEVSLKIISFFGIGSIASWVLDSWVPFTRYIWDLLFAWLTLPEIPDLEKDALTTAFFFLPMGLWALFSEKYNRENNLFQLPGMLTGILFLGVVGFHFFHSLAVTMVAAAANASKYALFGGAMAILCFSCLFAGSVRNKWKTESRRLDAYRAPQELHVTDEKSKVQSAIDRRTKPKRWFQTEETYRQAAGSADSFSSPLNIPAYGGEINLSVFEAFSLLSKSDFKSFARNTRKLLIIRLLFFVIFFSFISILLSFFVAIGPIAGFCLILIACLSMFSVILSPYRVFIALGVVLAFVLSGLAFDIVVWLAEAISATARQTS